MVCGAAAQASIVRRFPAWSGGSGRCLALLLLGSWMHVGIARSADSVDCASINVGRLEVAMASGSSTLRTVEMTEGDTLVFTFGADTRAKGTITLVASDGREQRLPYGPHATQVSYTAERAGMVRFRLATNGGKVATFVATCNPARGSGAMAPGGVSLDMSVPFSLGAPASQDRAASPVATLNPSPLQWLGGQQLGTEAPAGTYGVNLKLQPTLMVGVLAQFDQTDNPLLGPSALSEQPWLVGPVMSMVLGGGLSLDARAAWGSADPTMGHAADRLALDARLISKQEAGPWRFSPSIGFAHMQARTGTAAEHSADAPGQSTVDSGRVEVKPEMAYRIDMGQSMYMEPKIMVGTFWNLGDAAKTGTAADAQHEARPIAETGITFGGADGSKLQVGGGVQQGETRSESVWSGKIQLNIPLK